MPEQYIDFMKRHNGGEGDIGESWLILFALEELQEMNMIRNGDLIKYIINNRVIMQNNL